MARFNPFALSLLAAPACAEVVSVFLAMEPPRHSGPLPPPPPPMTAEETEAMRDVEEYCSVDVMMRCSHDDGLFTSDPMLNWVMRPMEPPPFTIATISDPIGDILSQMMDSALSLPEEDTTESVEPPKDTPVERVFDTMVTSLAEHVSSESASADEPEEDAVEEARPAVDPVSFAKRVVEFGHEVLEEKEAPEDRRRLARRLTQVEPNTFMKQNHPRLPFGCHKSRCLWSAFDHGLVSRGCTAALVNLENVVHQQDMRRERAIANVQRMEQQQDAFLFMVFIYGILALGTMILLVSRFRKRPDKMRLKRRILQAIYSNPALKAALEKELHEDLGTVPPLPPHLLASMSAEGRKRIKNWKRCRVVRLLCFVGLMWLAIVQPFVTMFLLCIMMGVRFFQLCMCPKKPIEDCTCCCCGGSTENLREGTVSAQQACCTCCRGTGVCAPGCESCCGGQPCPCDCSDGCDCCTGDVDLSCCCCCCCGVSQDDVRQGNVTAEQQCCTCCRGTGKCACDCGCCGDATGISAPPATRRRKRYAQNMAYEGVPVQVV